MIMLGSPKIHGMARAVTELIEQEAPNRQLPRSWWFVVTALDHPCVFGGFSFPRYDPVVHVRHPQRDRPAHLPPVIVLLRLGGSAPSARSLRGEERSTTFFLRLVSDWRSDNVSE
ncbi:hypothetical protein EHI47_11000 [Rhizobium leguminosarum]|uniref:Uncharacterized protein n=1 Tax=Rhizobium leguminosarum TaxID=384 RepID=A0A444I3W1_RHILE|nr:hypothetical protein EHI47_11000 [Rhizobium leguminosarum]